MAEEAKTGFAVVDVDVELAVEWQTVHGEVEVEALAALVVGVNALGLDPEELAGDDTLVDLAAWVHSELSHQSGAGANQTGWVVRLIDSDVDGLASLHVAGDGRRLGEQAGELDVERAGFGLNIDKSCDGVGR